MCIGNVAVKLELRQTGVVRGAFSTSHATSHGAFEPLEAPLKLQVTSKVSGFHVSQQLLACVLPSHCHVEGRLLATEFNNISIRKPMSMDLTGARSPLGSKIYLRFCPSLEVKIATTMPIQLSAMISSSLL